VPADGVGAVNIGGDQRGGGDAHGWELGVGSRVSRPSASAPSTPDRLPSPG
jgi:hypothetical protein